MPSSRSTTGLPPGVHVGPTGPRLLAAMVEVGPVWLLVALAVLFSIVLPVRDVVAILCMVLAVGWAVLVWAQRATKAAGPGMRLDSIQIVGFHDGRPIGWSRVLLRALVFAGLTLTVVGLVALAVAMSRHPRRQGWHDLAADAVVIKERSLAPPRRKPAVARTAEPAQQIQETQPIQSTQPIRPIRAEPAARRAAPPGSPATAVQHEPVLPRHAYTEPGKPEAGPDLSSATSAVVASINAQPSSASSDLEAAAVDRPDLGWWLRLDDGREVGVDGLVLLGRNPQPRVGEEDATMIKVVDETRTVSKSHLAVGIDARGLYVMDRGSTNGTTVTGPDGNQRPCPPGDLVDVPGGAVISFGDHWLEVRRRDR
jgi:uncharacterized RDD family membrane protein YckC